ncbi:MAG TPA: TRAP transporter small permease [Syntrophales bacterium]|jgi:TRAP-type C4-dicarboxylate transport system permease small subunit|nr:TRAP transporter small permease [Syntrophales bacterium]
MMKKKGPAGIFLDRLNTAVAWIAAFMVIFMMFAISCAVAARYLWGQSVPWVVEISSYLMLYITFLGTAWLLRQNGHVEVDLILNNLKPRTAAGFRAVTSVAGALVSLVLAWQGAVVTIDYFEREVTVMGILDTPQWMLVGVIPLGGFLLFIVFVARIWVLARFVMGGEENPEPD